LGGDIRVTSEVKKGSTFTFHVPYQRIQKQIPTPSDLSKESFLLSGCKVLVVDDNPLLRKVLMRTLSGQGCTCYEAEDGEKALLILSRDLTIDVVFLDLIMPVMDG
jgi:PleD family two-component response regulator